MNTPKTTGNPLLDGLLKRAREEKQAHTAPQKRAAIDASNTTECQNATPKPAHPAHPQSHTHQPANVHPAAAPELDADEDLLSYNLDDIDSLLDEAFPEDVSTLSAHTTASTKCYGASTDDAKLLSLNPPAQQQPLNQQPKQTVPQAAANATTTATTGAMSQSPTASTKLARFLYSPPKHPIQGTTRQNTTTPNPPTQSRPANSPMVTPIAKKPSVGISSEFINRAASVGKTIEKTIVEHRRLRTSASSRTRQEIPGPAGLLNSLASIDLDSSAPTTSQNKHPANTAIGSLSHSEQTSEVDFDTGTWAAMLDFLRLPLYTPRTAKTLLTSEHHSAIGLPIRHVLGTVNKTQRIPRMLVQLRDVNGSEMDANAVVVDPTGEMGASIHKQVLRDLTRECTTGTSIILENVVAIVLPASRPFLVITSLAIKHVFAVEAPGTHLNPIMITQAQTQTQIQTQTQLQVLTHPQPQKSSNQDPHEHDHEHKYEPDLRYDPKCGSNEQSIIASNSFDISHLEDHSSNVIDLFVSEFADENDGKDDLMDFLDTSMQ